MYDNFDTPIWIMYLGIHRHVQSTKFLLRGWALVLCINTSDIYLQSTCEFHRLTVILHLEHGNVLEIGSEIICDSIEALTTKSAIFV